MCGRSDFKQYENMEYENMEYENMEYENMEYDNNYDMLFFFATIYYRGTTLFRVLIIRLLHFLEELLHFWDDLLQFIFNNFS